MLTRAAAMHAVIAATLPSLVGVGARLRVGARAGASSRKASCSSATAVACGIARSVCRPG